jgi:hypothetical protein
LITIFKRIHSTIHFSSKESRPSKEIAKQVRKNPRRDRSRLNSPETLPKEKQILERINEGDLTGEENDEEKEIKRVYFILSFTLDR